jgi:hypothetical protein
MPKDGVAVTVAMTGARLAGVGVGVGVGVGEVGVGEFPPPHAASMANRHRGSRRRIVDVLSNRLDRNDRAEPFVGAERTADRDNDRTDSSAHVRFLGDIALSALRNVGWRGLLDGKQLA